MAFQQGLDAVSKLGRLTVQVWLIPGILIETRVQAQLIKIRRLLLEQASSCCENSALGRVGGTALRPGIHLAVGCRCAGATDGTGSTASAMATSAGLVAWQVRQT